MLSILRSIFSKQWCRVPGDGERERISTMVDLSAVDGLPVDGFGGTGEGVGVGSARAAN